MGVITSIPKPIKIQLQDIQATKTDYILDSSQYNNNDLYIQKAITEISSNKSIQKVILKLYLPADCKQDLSKSLSKLLLTKSTVVIYGTNLSLFDSPRWVQHWSKAKVSNLQLKFELMPAGFENLLTGVSRNPHIRVIGFRYLSDYQLKQLGSMIGNTGIYHLQITLENRQFTLDIMEDGIYSCKNPSTPQIGEGVSFLSQCRNITTFTLAGFQERSSCIMGISKNQSIKNLVLENIDVEKHLRADWNTAFKNNTSISEVKAVRGLNTLSALILFQSLRKNCTVASLVLEESVFYDHGFLGLNAYLKISTAVKNLYITNLLHLSISQFAQAVSLQNLGRILAGVAENRSLVNVYIGNNPAVSSEVQKLEKIDNSLSEIFFNLFKNNNTLKMLSIEYFKLGSESFPGISEGLAQNSMLEHVSFAGNLIKWEDFSKFSEDILRNNTLISIDLRKNCLQQDVNLVSIEVLDQIFENLKRANLKSFHVDAWFWNPANYPRMNQDTFETARVKYA